MGLPTAVWIVADTQRDREWRREVQMSGLQINVGLIGVTRAAAAACGEWDKVSHRLPILPIPNSESPILNVRCAFLQCPSVQW